VDTSSVEPSYHPMSVEGVPRGDEPRRWEWDPFLNAGHVEGKHFRGPRIT
jgi:Asp-tRNA(Asn)/Glu-tRNA(Gln) amidotransferase C subunit